MPSIKGNTYDSPSTQQVAEAFLQKYFQLYDTNRNGLIDVYTDQSLFSLTYMRGKKTIYIKQIN